MKKIIFLVTLTFILFSCGNKASESTLNDIISLSTFSKSEAPPPPPPLRSSEISSDFEKSEDVNAKDFAVVNEDVSSEAISEIKIDPDKVKPEVIKKKIIKDGRLGLQVENLQTAKQKIDSLVKSAGGYY